MMPLIRLAEATPVLVRGTLENDFKVTAHKLKRRSLQKQKAIIFSSPCNPYRLCFFKERINGDCRRGIETTRRVGHRRRNL